MQISSMGSAVGKVYSCCGEVCGSQSHQPIGPPVQLGECASAPNFQVLIGFSTLFYSLGVFFFFFLFQKNKKLILPQITTQLSMSLQINNCVNILPQTIKKCQCSLRP
jgi:hypothetical protein